MTPTYSLTARAPFRISLAGGGTDLPRHANQFGGQVVGFSINRFVEVSIRASHDARTRVSGLYDEDGAEPSDLRSPYLRAAFEVFPPAGPVTLEVSSEVRPGAGLGGSGAFLNALCAALSAARGNVLTPVELAETTSWIEINRLARKVGKQDHYLSALGGCNLLSIDRDLSAQAAALSLGPKTTRYFADHLLLFDTGIARSASKVLTAQDHNLSQSKATTLSAMKAIADLVAPMLTALRKDRPEVIGPLLQRHWDAKAALSATITTPCISAMIDTAISAGADGVKLIGAGGGGYLLVSTTAGTVCPVRAALQAADFQELAFTFEPAGVTLHPANPA